MKKRAWLLSLLLVATSTLLTGCWDRIEIEERGTILGLAIDPVWAQVQENPTGPHAQSDIEGYKLTAQVAIPGRIPLGPGGGPGGGGGEGGAQKPVWLISATGKTIDDAINTLQLEIAERVFLGHLRIIIVNQQLAQVAGLHDIMDFFRRNAEIRRLAWLIISKEDATRTLEATPKLERVPTLYLVSTMDHSVKLGKMPNMFLGNFWTTLSSLGQEPVLPLISARSSDQIKLEGLAVFRGEYMVDSLSPLEVAAYMELRNERRAGYGFALPIPGDSQHSVIFKGTIRKTKVKMKVEQAKPSFDMYSRTEVNIEEKTGHKALDHMYPQLSDEASKALLKGQKELVQKMQTLHTDIFGFGEYVRGRDPAYWVKVNTREKWDEEFAHLPVRLHCKVIIRRSGMISH